MKAPSLITQALINSLKPENKEYAIRDAQCPGLSIRVLPTGKMSWTVRTKQRDKWQRLTLGAIADLSLIEARAKTFTLLAGEEVLSKPEAPNALTFSKLAEVFLEAKNGVYKPDTIYCLKIYLDTQLLPAFGQTPINKLRTTKVAKWFHTYSRDRPGGANQAIGHLTTMLNFAKDQDHLAQNAPNPCAPIRRNKRKARGRLLTSKQLRTLGKAMETAPASRHDAVHAIRLILLTGCRSGEILRLTWKEIKRDRISLISTKTGERDVMLTPAAMAILIERKSTKKSPYVFPHPKEPNAPVRSITSHWGYFKEQAELPSGLRLHDLRHTFASHAIMSGETMSMTGKLLGHKRQASTEIYAHLDGSHLIRAAEKVSKRVAALLEGGV